MEPLLQSPINLESCLDDYLAEEALSGENQYFCERCKRNCNAR